MSLPIDKAAYDVPAMDLPIMSDGAATAAPIGLGDAADDGESLTMAVAFGTFKGPVDIYLGVYAPAISPEVSLFTGTGVQTLSAGLAPWKAGITGPVEEIVIPDLPVSGLPEGDYTFYAVVAPAGNLDAFYAWQTRLRRKAWPRIPVSDEAKLALLDSLKQATAALAGKDRYDKAEGIRAFLAGRPEIEEAGIARDGNVWARFKDGEPLLSTDVSTGLGQVPAPSAVTGEPPSAASWADGTPELTEGKRCVLLNSTGLPSGRELIGGLLAKQGYDSCVSGKGGVDELLAVRNADILFFSAHGSFYENGVSAPQYVLSTTTNANAETARKYKPLRDKGQLVWDCLHDDPVAGDNCYFWMTKRLARLMSFTKSSVVYVDACNSDDLGMLGAFRGVGASLYLGWDGTTAWTDSKRASEFFFDRLLGTNSPGVQPAASPPNRPFPFVQVWADLVSHGYDRSACVGCKRGEPGGRLWAYDFGFGGLLAPTIMLMTVSETLGELWISGFFGTRQGKVTVGGKEVRVLSWSSQDIRTDLSDPTLAGDVIVDVDGRKSDAAPLTEWRGNFTFTSYYGNSGVTETTLKLHIRADVRPIRAAPDQAPLKIDTGWELARDSSGTITGRGDAGSSDPLILDGGCSLVWGDNSNGVQGAGGFDLAKGEATFFLRTYSYCVKANGSKKLFEDRTFTFTGTPGGFLHLKTDAGFTIAGGKAPAVPGALVGSLKGASLEWTAIWPNPQTLPNHDGTKTPALRGPGKSDR